MVEQLSASARRFQHLLRDQGYAYAVVELPDSARTARDAASAVGCSVSQIAKSLVFRGTETGDALLAVVSGSNRADVDKLAALAGEPIEKANADFVRAQTGYSIGGVPPMGHQRTMRTFIDADLLAFDEVWAAGGTPHSVFCSPAAGLAGLTGGQVEDIKQQ